ncbi:hypothetical protein CSHISOI_11236 [Colletotrichum shisoi]|uniref:Uncharacterized protein n=1 Tax=Colletotrichum shisoi TaxID=2078593 RepID=A0A5Q4BBX5_9PEZI|nr:hypothetical protein CSHISOI_11236 [Colletotrichum shisoi]
MQLFSAIIVFASLAAAAPVAGNEPAVEARQADTAPPVSPSTLCNGRREPIWNTGRYGRGDGGWSCNDPNSDGVCDSYTWTTVLPYWSC